MCADCGSELGCGSLLYLFKVYLVQVLVSAQSVEQTVCCVRHDLLLTYAVRNGRAAAVIEVEPGVGERVLAKGGVVAETDTSEVV